MPAPFAPLERNTAMTHPKRIVWTPAATTLAFILGLVTAVTLPAIALGGAPLLHPFDGPSTTHRLAERLAERLELTPQQILAIRAQLQAQAPAIRDAVTAVQEARKTQFAAIHQHPPVEFEIRAAAAEVAEAATDLAVLRAEVVDSLYQILTPEQQAEWQRIEADLVALVESILERIQDRLDNALGA